MTAPTTLADGDDDLTPPPPARRQPGQLVSCSVEDQSQPDGFVVFDVRVDNRARLHYEKTAAKRGWPRAQDAQHSAMTFVTWSAAKREGKTAYTFEQWEERLIDYDVVKETPADPTPPTASPDGT